MIKYYVTNSFTHNGLGGNPAGVVYLGKNKFSDDKMLTIANQLGFSETAFITDGNSQEYDYIVKFFTPVDEVDLCGHATIASFYILDKIKEYKKREKEILTLKQKTLAGILSVELKYTNSNLKKVVMEQGTPEFYNYVEDTNKLQKIFGIKENEVGYEKLKPMICSTGLKDIIMPVKDIDTLRNLNIDFESLNKYSKDLDVVGVHAFTFIDKEKGIVECRNFAPAYGIDEESATGTSNGALGAYLVKNGVYTDEVIELQCIQGVSMDKTSEINVVVKNSNGDIEVKVGGSVTLLEEGYVKL